MSEEGDGNFKKKYGGERKKMMMMMKNRRITLVGLIQVIAVSQ